MELEISNRRKLRGLFKIWEPGVAQEAHILVVDKDWLVIEEWMTRFPEEDPSSLVIHRCSPDPGNLGMTQDWRCRVCEREISQEAATYIGLVTIGLRGGI